jgi:hypothetical protein
MKKLAIVLMMIILPVSFAMGAVTNTAKHKQYVQMAIKRDASLSLHKVTWKGKKWEYLVEHPTNIRHIHTVRFEEILDTAGQHGWELVTVSHAFHFYGFYFKRPLLAKKLKAHRVHLTQSKAYRAKNTAIAQRQIDESIQRRIANEKRELAGVQQMNKALQQEDANLKAVNQDLKTQAKLRK